MGHLIQAATGKAGTRPASVRRFRGSDAGLKATRLRPGKGGAVCRTAGAPLRTMHYAMRVPVGPHDAWLTLDSGANHTTLRPGSPVALSLSSRFEEAPSTMGVAGVGVHAKVARALAVRLLRHVVPVDVRLATTATERGADGRLGMDALRHCAVVLAEREVALACGEE